MCAEPLSSTVVKAVASEAGKEAGKSIAKKVGDALTRVPIDKSIADRSAFTDYLQNACARISHTKTILYQQPTSIDSFFEPTDISVNGSRSGALTSTKHVAEVLKLGSRLIIAGHAGAGKSIIMRHLFIDAYRVGRLLPVYVELRTINQAQEGTSIIDLIYQTLHDFGVTFSQDDLVRNLDSQKFLFLLDGLDEVSESRMAGLRDDIQRLGTEHPGAKIIMSSRLSEDEFRSWEDFVVASTTELSKQQAVSLVSRLNPDDTDAKELFSAELESSLYDRHKSFASNPLLLTMMLMVFSDRAAIPDDLTEFYSQTFDTLFRQHDARKNGKYHRELKCGLSDDEFKRVFGNFCFITFQKDEFVFTRELLMTRIHQAINRVLGGEKGINGGGYFVDLIESVCMLQPDGGRYTFVHRSFQEYFAATYTMQLDSDEKLNAVVNAWLDSHPIVHLSRSSVYLSALQNLNPDRLERQVVYKSLRKLRDTCYQSENPRYKFLTICYEYIEIVLHDDSDESIGFVTSSPSHNTLLHLFRESHNIPWEKWVSAKQPGCQEAILSFLETMPGFRASFDDIKSAGLVDTLLGMTDMGASGVFAAVDKLEEKYAQKCGASVLDDLYNL